MSEPIPRQVSIPSWRNAPTVYLAGPIKGMSFTNAVEWREDVTQHLNSYGIAVFNPLAHSHHLAGEENIKNTYENNPVSSQRGVFMHGKFAVMRADAILAVFNGSREASIGTSFELAWAHMAHKPVVSVIPNGNVHNHPFIVEASDFVVRTLEEAINIIVGLLK